MSFPVADKQKRSKNGCWTCRSKKVKCDEHRPICHRCDRLNLICDYLPRNKIKTRFIDESSLVMRRAHNAALQQQKHNPSDNRALIRTIKLIQSVPPQMSQERQTSASSLELSLADHEAIRYFRTVFAKIYATKNPEYSLFAIVFDIAERDPMVMRAILALGGQCIQHRRQIALAEAPPVPHTAVAAAQNPLQHYSAALRMMADTLDQREAYACFLHDLDSILATLYLMFLYEKTFGVGDGLGLSNHLSGAAHLVEDRLREQSRPLQFPRRNPLANRVAGKSSDAALFRFFDARQRKDQPLSLFSARILVHLAVQDSNASTFGFGGQLMTTLNNLTGDPEATWPFADGALSLHHYSHALYRTMWGQTYPDKELLDDLENNNLYTMGATVQQLRFAISTLGSLSLAEAKDKVPIAQDAMHQISIRFGDIISAADDLNPDTDSSYRLVTSLRGFVPLYDAVQVELCRVKRSLGYCDDESQLIAMSVDRIVRLAKQTYRHQGSDGLFPISWALYMAAMETIDADDRQWVMERLKQLNAQGKNFERAHDFLARSFATKEDGATSPVKAEDVDGEQLEKQLFVL